MGCPTALRLTPFSSAARESLPGSTTKVSGVCAPPPPPDGADASAGGRAASCPPPCRSAWGRSCSRFTTQSPVVVNLHAGVGASGKDFETGLAPEVRSPCSCATSCEPDIKNADNHRIECNFFNFPPILASSVRPLFEIAMPPKMRWLPQTRSALGQDSMEFRQAGLDISRHCARQEEV